MSCPARVIPGRLRAVALRRLAGRWYGWRRSAPADRPACASAREPPRSPLLVRRRASRHPRRPVLAAVYLAVALRAARPRGSPWHWASAAMVVGAAVAIPSGTVGAPPATQAPLARTRWGRPSPPARLAAACSSTSTLPWTRRRWPPPDVEPAAEVSWAGPRTAGAGRQPVGRWRPATYYTVTVGTTARDRDGRALASRCERLPDARVDPATISAVDRLLRVALDSPIVISFDRPVPIAGVLTPSASPDGSGQLLVAADGPEGSEPEPGRQLRCGSRTLVRRPRGYTSAWPTASSTPRARRDARRPLVFTTSIAPSVVRFRPRSGTEDVARDALLSVRFTAPMERASTAKAFSVEVDGKTVDGSVDFAEDDTVLVFDPKRDLPYGASIVMHVRGGALAADGTAGPPRAVGSLSWRSRADPGADAGQRRVVGRWQRRPPGRRPHPRAAPGLRPGSPREVPPDAAQLHRGGGWVPPTAPAPARVAAASRHSGTTPGSAARSRGRTPGSWPSPASARTFGRDPGDRWGRGLHRLPLGGEHRLPLLPGPDGCRGELVQFFQSEKTWSPSAATTST